MKGTTTITGAGAHQAARLAYERNKEVLFKYYALFTDCISETNNVQVNYTKDLNVSVHL